jgi:Peptidase M61 N-terminal domain
LKILSKVFTISNGDIALHPISHISSKEKSYFYNTNSLYEKICTATACIFCFSSFAKTNEGKVYKFTVDLINVANDKVHVELLTPSITATTITYHIPKIVPGTYSEDNFGRYIEQFKAYDKKGDTLQVVKSDVNSWTISNAICIIKKFFVY